MEFLLMAATILAASCPGAVYGDHEGTTSKIEDIFKGRCEYFRQFRLPESSTLRNLDCGTVWNAFTAAFKNKNECDVESQDYATFLDMTEMQIPEDKSLFWSGTQLLSHQYSDDGHRVYTIANTFSGYLVNQLVWCGSDEHPSGFNWTDCSSANVMKCEGYHNTAFWRAASQRYALQARGNIFLLINGSRASQQTYDPKSYFASVEIGALQPLLVTRVNIMIANDLNVVAKETCSTGSLLRLKADLERRGLSYSCVDNPKAIRYLLCVSDPSNSQCEFVVSGNCRHHSVGPDHFLFKLALIGMTVILLFY